jgi:hypothetical protein
MNLGLRELYFIIILLGTITISMMVFSITTLIYLVTYSSMKLYALPLSIKMIMYHS